MPNQIMTTGILPASYLSRTLITHNYDNAALVRGTDGILWAVFRENYVAAPLGLYRSGDSGFTWNKVWTGQLTSSGTRAVGVGALNTNGPHITLQLFEAVNRVLFWQAYKDTTTSQFHVEPFVFDITDPENVIRLLTTDDEDFETTTSVSLDADQMTVDAPYNSKTIFLSYINFNNLKVKHYRPTYQEAAEATSTHTGSYFSVFGCAVGISGFVDYLLLNNTGASTYQVVHCRYGEQAAAFTVDHVIENFGGTIDATDLSIAHDGYGNLCAFWSRSNATGTTIDVYYSISRDQGLTWTASSIINKSPGHSHYNDSITGDKAGRSTVLGGRSGFILSYVRDNSAGIPKTYVRMLTTPDGVTYTLGTEEEIATRVARSTEAVVGLRWFQPPGGLLLDLSDPGQVAVAYQIGEGNSAIQNDTVPVRIVYETLNVSAYPDTLDLESEVYTPDVPGENDVLVTVNILGGPSENIDYFAEGLTGSVTGRYTAAFNKIGTTIRMLKYEPLETSQMNDRSSYAAPVESTSLVLFEPGTYAAPLADRGNDGFTTFIERDIRKIYLPPDVHLDRTFTINRGNFLKRTIWTVYFDGNEYEVSQVVPCFISQQICYHAANCYVIGPSNNPFSRRVLPSET